MGMLMDNMYWSLLVSFSITDSESDDFHTLKEVSKVKSNGSNKSAKTDADGPHRGVKVEMKSPVRPPSHQSKAAKSPVTPKATEPPQPKQTPTSVLDYFGNALVQRSEKKLVASVKRKVVSVICRLYCADFTISIIKRNLIFSSANSASRWSNSR